MSDPTGATATETPAAVKQNAAKPNAGTAGQWLAVGAGVGVALGAALGNVGLVLALGVAIGAALDAVPSTPQSTPAPDKADVEEAGER
jgi:hypothetical protein